MKYETLKQLTDRGDAVYIGQRFIDSYGYLCECDPDYGDGVATYPMYREDGTFWYSVDVPYRTIEYVGDSAEGS